MKFNKGWSIKEKEILLKWGKKLDHFHRIQSKCKSYPWKISKEGILIHSVQYPKWTLNNTLFYDVFFLSLNYCHITDTLPSQHKIWNSMNIFLCNKMDFTLNRALSKKVVRDSWFYCCVRITYPGEHYGHV
jgi:hypothetical protein